MEAAAPNCEIHVFDFYDYGKRSEGNIHFHTVGVAGYSYQHKFPSALVQQKGGKQFPAEGVPMKSLPDLVRELGHTVRQP